ncbi:hypothetical protein ACLI4Y_01730 [Natrialbaceae archaeon A-CW3]
MDLSTVRWRYHVISTIVVVGVLAAFQAWQDTIDVSFLIAVGVFYFVLVIAMDLVRERISSS